MWRLNVNDPHLFLERFGDDWHVVQDFCASGRYQVVADTPRPDADTKFYVVRFEDDPSTPKQVIRKVLVGEFNNKEELVAIIKLMIASETN